MGRRRPAVPGDGGRDHLKDILAVGPGGRQQGNHLGKLDDGSCRRMSNQSFKFKVVYKRVHDLVPAYEIESLSTLNKARTSLSVSGGACATHVTPAHHAPPRRSFRQSAMAVFLSALLFFSSLALIQLPNFDFHAHCLSPPPAVLPPLSHRRPAT